VRSVLLLVALCSCNEFYGLDETTVAPPKVLPSDFDRDGIGDDVDICPGVSDPMQLDGDADGFGDVCDHCPAVASTTNHDEDGDTYGDPCDRCPVDPDFQRDADADGVGDNCDNDAARANRRLLFDSFEELAPRWQPIGTWSALGDAVTAQGNGESLELTDVVLDGAGSFEVLFGISTSTPLGGTDVLGIELVEQGVVVGSCMVRCLSDGDCRIYMTPHITNMTQTFTQVPTATVVVRRNPYGFYCVFAGQPLTDEDASVPVFGPITVRLVSTPGVHVRNASVVQ
jgi:hypothetical protein